MSEIYQSAAELLMIYYSFFVVLVVHKKRHMCFEKAWTRSATNLVGTLPIIATHQVQKWCRYLTPFRNDSGSKLRLVSICRYFLTPPVKIRGGMGKISLYSEVLLHMTEHLV